MAALGPRGRLCLPEEAEHLSGLPGEVLRLSVEPRPLQNGFTLEPAPGAVSTHLCLEIRYVLPVHNGYIQVPADLRRIADLDGKQIAYETRIGIADLAVRRSEEPLRGRDLTCLEPEGWLLLPQAFLRDLKEDWQVLLCAQLEPKPSFRLTYYL